MKKIIIIISLFITAFGFRAMAQNEMDALRYSQLGFGGTARVMAMGGAFSALGADFSVLSTNPGGIGLYKSSEFTLTPSVYTGKTESSYFGSTYDDSKYNFNVSNAGMVYAFELGETGFTHCQFAFGINRTNNFHNRSLIYGFNPTNSMADQFVSLANGTHYDNLYGFNTQLAFNTYVIDTAGGSTNYTNPITGGVQQEKYTTTRGSMNEFVLSFGGNYEDKLYVGATVGFPYLRYQEESMYMESDTASTGGIPNFNYFKYNEDLTTTGNGVNFKFGMIYRPIDLVRIGLALHTPTWYSMHDSWQTWMSSDMENGNFFEDESPLGVFDYNLTTPWRAIGSIAFVIGKHGIITGEYEFVDYAEASLRAKLPGESFMEENNRIRNNYTTATNIRVGGELRLDAISIRGGFAHYGSPFDSSMDNDGARTSFTGGIGFRQQAFFLDLAFVHTVSQENYYLYDPEIINAWTGTELQAVNNSFTKTNVLMTIGYKF